jgi:hypothetical protein
MRAFMKIWSNKTIRIGATVAILGLLTSCATPYVPEATHVKDKEMTCQQISLEIEAMRANISEAQKDAGFKASYILIIPGIVSNGRVHKAVEASNKRIAYLENLMALKGCAPGAIMPPATLPPAHTPYLPPR